MRTAFGRLIGWCEMKLSAKTEYACLAVLELSRAYEHDEPVRIRTIAAEHRIPSRFLVQILLQLKAAGLVTSTRGALGGYQLTRPPEEITLGEVISMIEGQDSTSSPATAKNGMRRAILRAWRDALEAQQERLQEVTFADLLQRAAGEVEQMYHI